MPAGSSAISLACSGRQVEKQGSGGTEDGGGPRTGREGLRVGRGWSPVTSLACRGWVRRGREIVGGGVCWRQRVGVAYQELAFALEMPAAD
jgi:hypothetical protein